MKKKLLIIFLFSITIILPKFIYGAHYDVIQLTDNSYDDRGAEINKNGFIVWTAIDPEGEDTGDYVYLYDGVTSTRLSPGQNPKINDQGHVVWRHGFEIYYYNGIIINQLTNNSYRDYDADISNDGNIAWLGNRPFNGDTNDEIFLYDGATITRLTNNGYDDDQVKIGNNKQLVWTGSIIGSGASTDWEIFHYDGVSITRLTYNNYRDTRPQINDIGHIVWQTDDASDEDEGIYFYAGFDILQITNGRAFNPQLNNNDQIVWQEMGDTNSIGEIYLYDRNITEQLTDNNYEDGRPQLNDIDQVTWLGGDGSDNWEIYVYEGVNTTRLTDDSYKDLFPKISNCGYVVWEGWDGTDMEIFLATRIIEPTIDDIIDFILAHEDIVGIGPGNSANNKYNAFLNMLNTVADLIEAGDNEGACDQLNSIMGKCDPDNPPNFITGPDLIMDELMEMIIALMESLGCD